MGPRREMGGVRAAGMTAVRPVAAGPLTHAASHHTILHRASHPDFPPPSTCFPEQELQRGTLLEKEENITVSPR